MAERSIERRRGGKIESLECNLPKKDSRFRLADMVWAKVRSHPWWPGQIYDPAFASSLARKSCREGLVLVAFFGDSTFGWFSESELLPFDANFHKMSKQTTARSFCAAVEDALEEVGRRVAFGLACACRRDGKTNYGETSGNPKVKRRRHGGLNLDGQVSEIKKDFRGQTMLSFVKSLACSPCSSRHDMLWTTKAVVQMHAFRTATFACTDSEFEKCFENDGSMPSEDIFAEDRLRRGHREHTLEGAGVVIEDGDNLFVEYGPGSGIIGRRGRRGERACTDERLEHGHPRQVIPNKKKRRSQDENPHDERKKKLVRKAERELHALSSVEASELNSSKSIGEDRSQVLPEIALCRTEDAERMSESKSVTGATEDRNSQAVVKKTKGFKRLVKSLKCMQMDLKPKVGTSMNVGDKKSYQLGLSGSKDASTESAVHVLNGRKQEKELAVGSLNPSVSGNLENQDEKAESLEVEFCVQAVGLGKKDAGSMLAESLKSQNIALPGWHAEVSESVEAQEFQTEILEPSKIAQANDYDKRNSELKEARALTCSGNDVKTMDVDAFKVTGTFQMQDEPIEKSEIDEFEHLNGRKMVTDAETLQVTDGMKTEETARNELFEGEGYDLKLVKDGIKVKAEKHGVKDVPEALKIVEKHSKQLSKLVKGMKPAQFLVTEDEKNIIRKRVLEKDVPNLKLDGEKKKQKVVKSVKVLSGMQKFVDGSVEGKLISNGGKCIKIIHNSSVDPILKKHKTDELEHTNSVSEGGSYLEQLFRDLILLATNPVHCDEGEAASKMLNAFARFRKAVFHNSNIYDYLELSDSSAFVLASNNDVSYSSGDETGKSLGEEIPKCEPLKTPDGTTEMLDSRLAGKEILKRAIEHYSDSPMRMTRKIKPPALTKESSSSLSVRPTTDAKLPLRASRDGSIQFGPVRHHTTNKSGSQMNGISCLTSENNFVSNDSAALFMKFPRGFALPSEVQLRATFVRFGPLDPSGTRIYRNSGSAQVLYRHASDADTALKYVQENNVFGQASVNFRLRQISQNKEMEPSHNLTDSSKESQLVTEESILPLPTSKKQQTDFRQAERLSVALGNQMNFDNKIQTNIQSCVPLKSCIKKMDDPGWMTSKNCAKVTFQLSSRAEIGQSLPCTEVAGKTPSGDQVAGEVRFENSNSVPQNNSLPLLGSPCVRHFESPAAASSDIGNQMMTLLQRVSALVGSSGIVL